MRNRLRLIVAAALVVGVMGGMWSACSTTSQPNSLETLIRNLTAAQCDNQAATLANIPLGLLSQAQAAQLLSLACAGIFGTAPAPTPAPGNNPVIPGATAVPTPAGGV
jgi:hypothetical protein